jgi:hypothetical protein
VSTFSRRDEIGQSRKVLGVFGVFVNDFLLHTVKGGSGCLLHFFSFLATSKFLPELSILYLFLGVGVGLEASFCDGWGLCVSEGVGRGWGEGSVYFIFLKCYNSLKHCFGFLLFIICIY